MHETGNVHDTADTFSMSGVDIFSYRVVCKVSGPDIENVSAVLWGFSVLCSLEILTDQNLRTDLNV